MSKKTISAAAVIFFLAIMGTSVAQQFGHDGRGMHSFGDPDRMLEMMTTRLDLSDDQAQQIRDAIAAKQPQMEQLRTESRAHREAMSGLDPADADYGVKLQNLSAESGVLASQATLLFGELRSAISAHLTDEQRQKLQDGMHRMRDRKRHDGSRENRRHRDSDVPVDSGSADSE